MSRRRTDHPPKARPPELLTLGARLHLARKAKKLTLAQVGEALGISPQAVGQWEHDEARPGFDRLERLAAILEIELATMVKDKPADLTILADRVEGSQEKIAKVVSWRDNYDDVTPFPVPIHAVEARRRNSAYVGEINFRDCTPATQDLRLLPEYYLWALPLRLVGLDVAMANVRVMRVLQDDMAPTFLPTDYAIIDAAPPPMPIDGRIYLLRVDNNLMRRRVALINGTPPSCHLIADNTSFPNLEVAISQVHLLGHLIGRVSIRAL